MIDYGIVFDRFIANQGLLYRMANSWRNFQASRAIGTTRSSRKILVDIHRDVRHIHKCLYYGHKNRDLVLLRSYLSRRIYDFARNSSRLAFYKDLRSAKLVQLRHYHFKDIDEQQLAAVNVDEYDRQVYADQHYAQATFRMKFRDENRNKCSQYFVFTRPVSDLNPYEKWKLVSIYDGKL